MTERPFRSVPDLFAWRVESSPDADAMYGRRGSEWTTLSWREVARRVRRIACGLHALGFERKQRASILCATRPEWVLIDLGILSAAGATSTLYPSNTAEECAYILADSGARYCFVENADQAAKLVAVRSRLESVERVIWVEGEPPPDDPWQMSLAALEELGEAWDGENPRAFDEIAASIAKGDLATLIYTSGTTGRPKGVMLTHDNWLYQAEVVTAVELLSAEDVHYLFLPLAHSFAKALEVAFIKAGSPTAVDGDLDAMMGNLQVIRPHVLAAVPRVFEKVHQKVVSGASEAGGLKAKLVFWALGIGHQVSALAERGERPSLWLELRRRLAHRLVFSKIHALFGGRIRFFVSGGAPLSPEIARFMDAVGLRVLEGYGLTESTAGSFINRYENYKFGTVGLPMPGTEVKIDADGEVLLRGRGIMQGYYNLPEETAEALIEDGWFRTGDIGELDEDGFLSITDRKKDLIVTAGGKNVAPQLVENLLKARSRFVSQVVMLGDKRPYCIALMTLNEEVTATWAAARGVDASGAAELAASPEVRERVWQDVAAVNAELPSYQQIKKIRLLDREFNQEAGELTAKMSIKRRVVERRHQAAIDELYAEGADRRVAAAGG